jgi:hypothetical protein
MDRDIPAIARHEPHATNPCLLTVMPHPILDLLTTIRHRQERNLLLGAVGRGLLVGAAAALVPAALTWAVRFLPAAGPMVRLWVPVAMAVLAALAVLAGLVRGVARRLRLPTGLKPVARLVDAQANLQDRTITALAFLEKTELSPVEELQLAEASGRLANVDPAAVVPGQSPKWLILGMLLLATASGSIAAAFYFPAKTPPPQNHELVVSNPPAKPPAPPTTSKPVLADLHWQPAPAAMVAAARSSVQPGVALEQFVAEMGRAADTAVTPTVPGAAAQPTVLEGERLPLEYRKMLRQYFESIRPTGP